MTHLGYTHAKQLFVVYLKFKCNWVSCISFAESLLGQSVSCSEIQGQWCGVRPRNLHFDLLYWTPQCTASFIHTWKNMQCLLCVWQYSFVKNTFLCLRLTLLHPFYEFLLRIMAYYFIKITLFLGFPGDSNSKESACNAGGLGSIPGSGRSPGEGNGNSLPHSCLENFMDGGAWQATGCKELY